MRARWLLAVPLGMSLAAVGACATILGYDDFNARPSVLDSGSTDASFDDAKHDAPDTFVATEAASEAEADAAAPPARVPSRPPGPVTASGTGKTMWFVLKRLYLSTEDASGTKVTDAWKQWGWDIDGRCTDLRASTSSTDSCTRSTSSAPDVLVDGDGCRDNNFGSQLMKIISGLAPTFEDQSNTTIQEGAATWLIRLQDVDDGANDSFVTGAVYKAAELPGWGPSGAKPKWDGTDVRRVIDLSLTNPTNLDSPVAYFSKGYIAGNVFVSGDTRSDLMLHLPFAAVDIPLVFHGALLTIPLTSAHDGAGGIGLLAGGISVDELKSQIPALGKAAGAGLCPGQFLYDSAMTTVPTTADLYVSGTDPSLQDTTKACDGISIGLGMQLVNVQPPTTIVPAPPNANLCGDGG